MSKYKHIYGPVQSRRLGVSLGIDLGPFKICSENCVYCEIGKTKKLTVMCGEYINHNEFISEINSYLKSSPILDYITFSDIGESTLNNIIVDIIHYLKINYSKYKIIAEYSIRGLFFKPKIEEENIYTLNK